jgi:hypothetical protein
MPTYGEELVEALSAATDVLRELPARAHRLTGSDLEAMLPVIDRLAAMAEVGRLTVTTEAVDRGDLPAPFAVGRERVRDQASWPPRQAVRPARPLLWA